MSHSEMNLLEEVLTAINAPASTRQSRRVGAPPTTAFSDHSTLQRSTSMDLLSGPSTRNSYRSTGIGHRRFDAGPANTRPLMSIPANARGPLLRARSRSQWNLLVDVDCAPSTDPPASCRPGLTRKKAFKSQPNLLDVDHFGPAGARPKTASKNAGGGGKRSQLTPPQHFKVMTLEILRELSERPVREVLFTVPVYSSGFFGLLHQADLADDVLPLVVDILGRIAAADGPCPHTARAFLQTVLYTPFVSERLPRFLQSDGGATTALALVNLFVALLTKFGSEAEAKLKRCLALARDLTWPLEVIKARPETPDLLESPIDPNERLDPATGPGYRLKLLRGLRRNLAATLARPGGTVYRDVRIVDAECSPGPGLIHKLHWSSPRANSKSLLLGALVFLGPTDAGPYHCAAVVRRDPAELDDGSVWVKLPNRKWTEGVLVDHFRYRDDSWSVMAALQASRDVALPFEKYFEGRAGRATGVRHPAYLDCDATYILDGLDQPVRVLDRRNWPVSESSDLEPLRHALTAEVALLKSPPGSEPVRVAQRLLRALVDNRATVWKQRPLAAAPVLVLCHSDAALDDFLSGVVEHATAVRVGGRCTRPALDRYDLGRQANLARDPKRVPAHVGPFWKVTYEKLCKLRADVHFRKQLLDQAKRAVLKLDTLRPFIADDLQRQLDDPSEVVDPLLKWLTDTPPPPEGAKKCPMRKAAAPTAYDEFLDDREMARRVLVSDHNEFVDLETGPKGVDATRTVEDLIRAEVRKTDTMSEAGDGRRIATLAPQDRWRLYRTWLAAFRNDTRAKMEPEQEKYEKAFQQLREVEREVEVHVLQQADVIGMTAVAAAKYHSHLHLIAPRIVIVLEAGRITEEAVVAVLTDKCQHLVLVGDHQQLQPRIGAFWQEVQLDCSAEVGVSIFQSLLKGGATPVPLSVQVQRAPSIVQLLEGLFPERRLPPAPPASTDSIRGMSSSVFFLNQSAHPESSADTPGSYTNDYEADFLLSLFDYLMKQGYHSSQVTLLAAYTGQAHRLKQLAEKKRFQGEVECATVDDYSGRSNDIVLLSLVRSNGRQDAGRLADPDFVYVALTRARLGLYCIGDFRMLAAGQDFWRSHVTFLAERHWYGSALTLQCVYHPTNGIAVQSPADLRKVGAKCQKTCDAEMACGHRCPKPCHSRDRGHKQSRCMQPCPKTVCAQGHRCPKKCSEECGQCTVPVDWSFACGHQVAAPCDQRSLLTACPKACDKRLPCGHRCLKKCGEACDVADCLEMTEQRDTACHHVFLVPCAQRQATVSCRVPCDTALPCGHRCQGTCGKCRQGRMHVPCTELCNRVLVCGHPCRAPCGQDCPPCRQACGRSCAHSRCGAPCGQPCVPCSEPCEWKCVHFRCGRMCFEVCDRPRCDAPCRHFLPCRHPCTGLCGEPCPPLCRRCHRGTLLQGTLGAADVDDARFVWLEECGHAVEVSVMDALMGGAGAVGAKQCPLCGRTVRKCQRYGNALKEAAADVDAIHRLYEPDPEAARDATERLQHTVATFTDLTFHAAGQQLAQEYSKSVNGHQVQVLENKLRLLAAMSRLWLAVDGEAVRNKFIVHDKLSRLQQWHQQLTEVSSCRQLGDVAAELRVVAYFVYLLQAFPAFPSLASNQQILYSYIHKRLADHSSPVAGFDDLIVAKLRELAKLCGRGFDEADIEKVKITNVWCAASGHWFKCSKGHVYHVHDAAATTTPQCETCLIHSG